MPKIIAFDQEAREAIRRGVSKLARAYQSNVGSQGPERDSSKELWQPHRYQGRCDWPRESNWKTSMRTWALAWFEKLPARPATLPATAPPPRL